MRSGKRDSQHHSQGSPAPWLRQVGLQGGVLYTHSALPQEPRTPLEKKRARHNAIQRELRPRCQVVCL